MCFIMDALTASLWPCMARKTSGPCLRFSRPSKGRRDARSLCNGGDGRTWSKASRETQYENVKKKRYAKALKSLNTRDEPITDRSLKRTKLQRLASGEIVPL